MNQVRQHRMPVVLSRASSNDADRLNALKTAHLSRRPRKLNELNTEESSLDRVQAAPFFVHRSAL
jgi:hypothetical protein